MGSENAIVVVSSTEYLYVIRKRHILDPWYNDLYQFFDALFDSTP